MTKKKKLIILGASGHGGVLLDLALLCEYEGRLILWHQESLE